MYSVNISPRCSTVRSNQVARFDPLSVTSFQIALDYAGTAHHRIGRNSSGQSAWSANEIFIGLGSVANGIQHISSLTAM